MPRKQPPQPPARIPIRSIAAEAGASRESVAGAAQALEWAGKINLYTGRKGARCTDEAGKAVLVQYLRDTGQWQPLAATDRQ